MEEGGKRDLCICSNITAEITGRYDMDGVAILASDTKAEGLRERRKKIKLEEKSSDSSRL